MAFHIYNTMNRRKEEIVPLEAGHVRMYTCGPTVYNFAHIGNFRAYLFEDLLRRWLKFKGFRVTQVQNLTDVDDKTIRDSQAAGLPLKEFTARYAQAFFDDIQKLNIEPAEHYPAATDHIPEMIAIIQTLLDKGHAYQAGDGSVYFRISSFPGYGKLAHLNLEGMQSGARVAQDEYDKDNASDFALWKAWTPADGEVAWDSPWGRGRPGWHIECSAMAIKYLGESFDIHTGGADNIFPHHEDEIAQSEAATGKPFCTYWVHCGYLNVDGKKMSKSLGNFHTLRDLTEQGFTGREIRFELLSGHYRQPLNFNLRNLEGNRTALRRLDEFRARLAEIAGPAQSGPLPECGRQARTRFEAAMDDDLNSPAALAALFDLVHTGNKQLDADTLAAEEAAALLELWQELDAVCGFLQPPSAEVPADIAALAEARTAAKKAKDFAEADRLRDAIAAAGWLIQDTPTGPKLKKT